MKSYNKPPKFFGQENRTQAKAITNSRHRGIKNDNHKPKENIRTRLMVLILLICLLSQPTTQKRQKLNKSIKSAELRAKSSTNTASSESCTLLDRIHFRKIIFPQTSFPATQSISYEYNSTTKVFFSVCQPLPSQAFQMCKNIKNFKIRPESSPERYIFLLIQNDVCWPIGFSGIRNIAYKLQTDWKSTSKEKFFQIVIELIAGGEEQSIIFPDLSIETVEVIEQVYGLSVRMPLTKRNYQVVNATSSLPVVQGGYFWTYELGGLPFIVYSVLRIIFYGVCFGGFKMGVKCCGRLRIRPFDLLMNFEVFSWITSLFVEWFGVYDMGWIIGLVLVFPLLCSVLINWKSPSFSWRVTWGKKFNYSFQSKNDPFDEIKIQRVILIKRDLNIPH